MPNIDFSGVQESAGGFEQLEPGGYVCRVTRVEPHPERSYAFFEWDVAEGPRAGHFDGANWPPRDVVSWKEGALGMTKHKLHVLADDNPGFDAEAAFRADDWEAFRGRTFGAVVRKRLYTKDDGTDGEGIEIGAWKRAEEIRSGSFRPLEPRDARDAAKARARGTAPSAPAAPAKAPADAYSDEDIPF